MSFDAVEIYEISKLLDFKIEDPRLKLALNMILEASVHSEALSLFTSEDYIILYKICNILPSSSLDIDKLVLSILINVSAESENLSEKILNTELMNKLKQIGRKSQNCMLRTAQLIANISRYYSKDTYLRMENQWTLRDLMGILTIENSEISNDCADYFGYVLMNYSTIREVRQQIAEKYLERLLSLLSLNSSLKKRYCASNILYNLLFDEDLHTFLLEQGGGLGEDVFLAGIVAPLADENDELSEEEIEKLPIQLQYYDKPREADLSIRQQLLQTLYQFCATKTGRETLRKKGIYAILRELDKSQNTNNNDVASNSMNSNTNLKLLSNCFSQSSWGKDKKMDETRTLHALIGILIQYEDEMEIPKGTFSLRELAS